MLKGKTIVLGVTGSIAAYKMANVASMLVKRGCEVHVVMTKNATNFINPIAFESLTNTKCLVETFDRNFQFHVAHVSLTDKADAMLLSLIHIFLASLIGGAMVYRMIISLVLHFGLSTDDMKLFTAIIVALALGIPALKSKYSHRRTPA